LRLDEIDFPGARPMLNIFLPLDRQADVIVMLGPYQQLQAVSAGKPLNHPLAMLPGSAGKIAAQAEIKRAVSPIGHQVYPSALHWPIVHSWQMLRKRQEDGRVKPGHDGGWDR
jgi:hypothetical protein